MKEFLATINWGDAAVTLLAAFGGAWFAYLFNLKQQKKWDRERREEEKKEQRAKEILELNYLQTYLHERIDDLYEIYQKLDAQRLLYIRTKENAYRIPKKDEDNFFLVFVDFSSKFSCNWDALAFTRNEPEFIYTLGRVETAWHRFVLDHRFGVQHFEKNVTLVRTDLEAEDNEQNKHLIIKKFVDSQLFNYESEIFRLQEAVSYLDMMLQVLSGYATKYKYKNELPDLIYDKETRRFVKQCIKEVPIKYNLKRIAKNKSN